MENDMMISNPHEIYKGDFETMVAIQQLECFSKSQVDQFLKPLEDLLEKSEYSDLDVEEKKKLDIASANLSSFNKWLVVGENFQKSIMFTRPQQVAWGEQEDDVVKGIYKDTVLNRKLDRVGEEIIRKA